MLRASTTCEAAGFPSASLICDGFAKLAAAASVGLGMPNIPIATVPGHPGVQSAEELRKNILEHTLDRVIQNLTVNPAVAGDDAEPGARDIIFKGGFEAVNRYFVEHEYSDGLPIVPPTRQKVEAFLRYTDRDPEESLGRVLPDNRAATIWSIAVNGVMAGCRPEYMPVLVALVEAMVDPKYGVEHSGNTPGGETLIVLNGSIIKELGFNYTQGVMRDGFQPNTSVGRFWRLYLRNIAGFLLHKNDKATYGNNYRIVVAENEDVLREIAWESNATEWGYATGENTVSIARYTGGNLLCSASGSTPEEIMEYLADGMIRQISWQLDFVLGPHGGTLRPMLFLSPILAQTIARGGWKKADVKKYLFDHARIPAWQFERMLRVWTSMPVWDLTDAAKKGEVPPVFHESDDPERLVPLVWKPEDYMVAVTGDLTRNNAYAFAHNGDLGYTVGKKVKLPKNWSALLAEATKR